MDFSTIDLAAAADRGADCHLDHPVTGEPLYTKEGQPIVMRVLGADSREFRAAIAAAAERNANKKRMSLDAAEAGAIDLLSKLVTGWKGIEWEGKALEFTLENVRMFLTKFPPIRQQIDQFIADRSNFFNSTGKK